MFAVKTTLVAKTPARQVRAAAAERASWLPGSKPPAHLDGSLPGDFGFDPLGLGKDANALKWYTQAELQNARWAMLANAGILFPALLTKAGALNVPDWRVAGQVSIENSSIPFNTLLIIQFILFGWVEGRRWVDILKPGSTANPPGNFLGLEGAFAGKGDTGYPGGAFDPAGFSKGSAAQLQELKLKEIKNGRLAMLGFLGYAAAGVATGKGPLDALGDHLANPWNTNFLTNGVSVPGL